MLFVNMIWAHAFLLSDKIPSLSRFLFLFASVRQPYKSPAVGRYGDLKFQAFTAALPPAGDLSIIASLEQEDTKVWQYSTDMLYLLFKQEEKTGKIEFPDV